MSIGHEHIEGPMDTFSSIWARPWENVSYAICEQQRRRSACTHAQSDQRLCCSLPKQNDTSSLYIRNFKILAGLCSWAGQFVSSLVGDSRRHIFSWRGSYRESFFAFLRYVWYFCEIIRDIFIVKHHVHIVFPGTHCLLNWMRTVRKLKNIYLKRWDTFVPQLPIERTVKTLIRLGGCPGWSESWLGAQVIMMVLSWGGSNRNI